MAKGFGLFSLAITISLAVPGSAFGEQAPSMGKMNLKFSTKMTTDEINQRLPKGYILNYLSADGKEAYVCGNPDGKERIISLFKGQICEQCMTPTSPDSQDGDGLHHSGVSGLQDALAGIQAHTPEDTDQRGGSSAPTYASQIAPLLQKHCVQCHRPGGVGGFSLMDYKSASAFAKAMDNAVQTYDMPHGAAWLPSEECGGTDRFDNPRFLTKNEMKMLHNWASQKQPALGNPADMPCPPVFKESAEWEIGKPDEVVSQTKGGFTVPPLQKGQEPGHDLFRNFILPVNYDADTMLKAIEIHPGLTERADKGSNSFPEVHHVHVFVDMSGVDSVKEQIEFQKVAAAEKMAGKPVVEGPGWDNRNVNYLLLGSWFPGSQPLDFGDRGLRIPKGAKVVVQVHYTQYSKTPLVDETKIGFRYAHEPVKQEIKAIDVEKIDGKDGVPVIPKGNPNFPITLNLDVNKQMAALDLEDKLKRGGVQLVGLVPHEHQIGQGFSMDLKNGHKDSCLLKLKWDFSHQQSYFLKKPVTLRPGEVLSNTCVYSNPDDSTNPFQPPRDVKFGPDADKEMCRGGYYVAYAPSDKSTPPVLVTSQVTSRGIKITGSNIAKGSHIEVNGQFLPSATVSANGKQISWTGNLREVVGGVKGPLQIAVVGPLGDRSKNKTVKR